MNMPIDGDEAAPVRRAPAKKKAKAKRSGRNAPARNAAIADAEANLARIAAAPRRMAPRDLGIDRQPRKTREMARETTRKGAVVVEGRDGEMLTRRRTNTGPDKFEILKSEIPEGWTYQWNAVSVVNMEMVNEQTQMHMNGWRPVPASRHPGRWFKPGHEGAIVIDGLRLEERPEAMTQEAQLEDRTAARKLMRDQTDALKLTQKLPEGFSDAQKYRGTGVNGRVKMAIDPSLTLPEAGDYEEAED